MTKKFNKTRLAVISGLALAASLTSSFASAEISGEIGVTNDYRFRGVSQTAGDPAIQGSLDYSHDSGFFAGAWASNVDFDEPDYSGPAIELDLYAGYAGEINDDLTYDVTLYRYNYLSDSDLNYFEVTAGMDFSGFRVAYWYTNDYGGSDLAMQYIETNYSYPFAENWSLDLHVGYNFGEATDLDNDGYDTYIDYSFGVSTEISSVSLSLAWLATTIDNDLGNDSGLYETSGKIMIAASYAF